MIKWKIFKGQTSGKVYYDVTKFQGYLLGGYGMLTKKDIEALERWMDILKMITFNVKRTEYVWYLEHGYMDGFSKDDYI